MQYDDLAMLSNVEAVDQAPLLQFVSSGGEVIRVYAAQVRRAVIFAVADVRPPLGDSGSDFLQPVVQFFLCQADVFHVEPDVAAFLVTSEGLCRPSRIYVHRIGSDIGGRLGEGMNQSVAGAEQHDEHEYSPSYGEARKKGAKFVPLDGTVYFLCKVDHAGYFNSPLSPNRELWPVFSSIRSIRPSFRRMILFVSLATPLS